MGARGVGDRSGLQTSNAIKRRPSSKNLRPDDWRKIAIALIDAILGEEKAQSCANAFHEKAGGSAALNACPPAAIGLTSPLPGLKQLLEHLGGKLIVIHNR